jgi:peptidoglycan/xylan/chitin deacetylase (PgdA/CDA1 family)/folate-dependent phosphoribosylglycinamide formyltransferase PurN
VALRLVVTTRQSVRHRLFLALLESALGRPPDGVLIQLPGGANPGRTTAAALNLFRVPFSHVVAPRSFDVARRLARHRLEARPAVDDLLCRGLAPLLPVELDELAMRTDVRLDADPNSAESAAWLERLRPELILVFGGRILREPWLSLPRRGSVNMHYGLLPWYAGAASAEYALYHDRADRVGVTIHAITSGVDSGPVIRRLPVAATAAPGLEECQAEVYRAGIGALVEHALLVERGESYDEESQVGTRVYRRDRNALVVEAVAEMRLRRRGETFPLQRALDRVPRGRGLRGRIAPGRIPAGVYVLLYHSIVDPSRAEPWELSFSQVATLIGRFREQTAYLAAHLTPTTLTQAFELLQDGPADRAYFALTFDDGYTNLATAALPICREHGLQPTVFASATFAAGEATHYRVLLAELVRRGYADATAAILAEALPDHTFDATNLWAQSKDTYRPGVTETATERAWSELVGEPWPRAHLSFEDLAGLVESGWSVGNHTLRHVPLVGLDSAELDRQLLENEERLAAAGLDPIPWISYPFGRVAHVDAELDAFLDRHPDYHGIFAAGGVNVVPSRKEWLRLSVEGDVAVPGLRRELFREARATLAALDALCA